IQRSPSGDNRVYWLLLVRPDGILRYYEFMEALGDLDVAVGYELVERDWQFDFPESAEPRTQSWVTGPIPTTRPRPTPPPPLRGRAGVGGNESPVSPGTPGTPHPNPPPQGRREQIVPPPQRGRGQDGTLSQATLGPPGLPPQAGTSGASGSPALPPG